MKKTAPSARSYTLLSIAAALLTIALKAGAYGLTGSVGLLSDAMESGINLVAAVFAFWALSYAAKPPDEEHPFGHSKAEYFSSGLESALIMVAAVSIGIAAWPRLLNPQPLEQIGVGLALSLVATAINGGVAWILLRAGKRLNSIALKADGHHLLTDVWTSVGVVVGLLLVKLTGWLVLDPIIALLVAANIIWAGARLMLQTGSELLDRSISQPDQQKIQQLLSEYEQQGIQFHALRTRTAGSRRFVSIHVLAPGSWTVQKGHDLCDQVELAIAKALPRTHVMTHLEPLEDPVSFQDQNLDR
ncbi:MAG: cation diffusion facilitator family transporter [Drouetiella hepatica Uher 2000/2452]|jgi:cation diffusion facilitator family transporter|uniref:Cation diffusion facilitator family transporter n=1 Tax=Drouetiella hepatica Uher 2000/2452 TaxID=904376 RepID=A0A951Q657_9CYAN|nr:cation diffusion facilitator family transporter [Drouetiella hepatica Uher 2000/2452]